MHGIQATNQTMTTQDKKNTTANKLEDMDIEKDSHKRKEPQTPRTGHRKTKATSTSTTNIE